MATQFQFEADLNAFADKIDAKVAAVQQNIGLAVYRGVKERTPVLTGFAKSNWQAVYGTLPEGVREIGEYAGQDEGVILGSPLAGDVILWIANRAPYIVALEYGHSQKAPDGMARLTIESVRARMMEITAAADAQAKAYKPSGYSVTGYQPKSLPGAGS